MGKYSSNARRQARPQRNNIPPLVRGIGCITMVLIPLLSYGVADYMIEKGPARSWPIPLNLLGAPNIPEFMFRSPALSGIAAFLQNQNNLSANLILALAITIIIGGLMSIVYGYVFAMFGPSKYGPTDVPPPRVKTKKYTR